MWTSTDREGPVYYGRQLRSYTEGVNEFLKLDKELTTESQQVAILGIYFVSVIMKFEDQKRAPHPRTAPACLSKYLAQYISGITNKSNISIASYNFYKIKFIKIENYNCGKVPRDNKKALFPLWSLKKTAVGQVY